jgi:hypothetical protein
MVAMPGRGLIIIGMHVLAREPSQFKLETFTSQATRLTRFLLLHCCTHNPTGYFNPAPRPASKVTHKLTNRLRLPVLAQDGVPRCCRSARLLYRPASFRNSKGHVSASY